MKLSEYIVEQLTIETGAEYSTDQEDKGAQYKKYDWYVIEKDAIAVEVGIGKQERASYFLINKCTYKLVKALKKHFKDLETIYLEPKSIEAGDIVKLIDMAADMNVTVDIIDDVDVAQRGQTQTYQDSQVPIASTVGESVVNDHDKYINVGDRVRSNYGKHKGKIGTVIENPAKGYAVVNHGKKNGNVIYDHSDLIKL
jgi:hypothetical protein